ncbi:MAG: flagellar basal body rod protein FlgB [Syntrophomonadaceae bacterium]|nr:flagellar basal body rod protein FlgB [Syntrophomonadaceae bacterium]
MIEKFLSTPTQKLLNQALNASQLRNDVIANNIANVDTPGFKRSEVIFEDNIRQALHNQTKNAKLKTTNIRHIQVGSHGGIMPAEIITLQGLTYRNDGNNVDIDVENAKLAKNKILYDAVGDSFSKEIKLLRLAITGRS